MYARFPLTEDLNTQFSKSSLRPGKRRRVTSFLKTWTLSLTITYGLTFSMRLMAYSRTMEFSWSARQIIWIGWILVFPRDQVVLTASTIFLIPTMMNE